MQVASNRRRSTRIHTPGGSAWSLTQPHQEYQVVDASTSGVALTGGPTLELGLPLDLELWWPQVGAATARAVVCRHDHKQHKMALQYEKTNNIDKLIERLHLIDNARSTASRPLFCGLSAVTLLAIDQLRDQGFSLAHARTPLESIQILHDPWQLINSVVMDGSEQWLQFAHYLHTEEPHLRRVFLQDHLGATAPSDVNQFDVVLVGPHNPHTVQKILDLPPADKSCLACHARLHKPALPFCAPCLDASIVPEQNNTLHCRGQR